METVSRDRSVMTEIPARSATCLAVSFLRKRANFRRSPRLLSSAAVFRSRGAVFLDITLIFLHSHSDGARIIALPARYRGSSTPSRPLLPGMNNSQHLHVFIFDRVDDDVVGGSDYFPSAVNFALFV